MPRNEERPIALGVSGVPFSLSFPARLAQAMPAEISITTHCSMSKGRHRSSAFTNFLDSPTGLTFPASPIAYDAIIYLMHFAVSCLR